MNARAFAWLKAITSVTVSVTMILSTVEAARLRADDDAADLPHAGKIDVRCGRSPVRKQRAVMAIRLDARDLARLEAVEIDRE